MKNKILIGFAFLAVLIGCQEDEYEAPNSFSDFGFYTGLGTQSDTLQLNIFDYLSFADLSQGYIEHNWSIEKGNNFLEGPINSRDSVLEQFIIYDGDTITEDKTVHVLFNNSGYQKVRLRNIFEDSVTFRGNKWSDAAGEKVSYFKPAVKEGNFWVMDTTIVVKVYDTIIPEIEVRQFGAVVNHESTDTIYVEAGDQVQFIDKTTIGEPTGRYWSVRKTLVEGAVASENDVVASSSAEVADIIFKKLGNFTASITANRTGQDLPGDSERYNLTSPFKVIPSSKPFVLTGVVKELEDETIQIPFNGEFAPFLEKEEFFKVSVNGVDFAVSSVSINTNDSTLLDIVLAEKIYRPDVITISLLDGSGIESTDTRVPVAFTDIPVIMHDVNLLTANQSGFEDGGGTAWAVYWSNNATAEFSREIAFSGDYSIKLDMVPGQKEASMSTPASDFTPILNKSGEKFVVSWKMFITEDSNTSGRAMGLFRFPTWAQTWVNLDDKPKGEWVTVTGEFAASNITGFYLRIINGNLDSDLTVYYDDFKLIEKEERP
ncbi:hypothetical protein [Lutibacter citreus]|uniref:hypothetical protein n=1 Tax=Lutibacter citreus TaxID=2138210 RepID=UPI001300A8D9|nr:hypothetical protein [Lutibacter citreus]